MSFSYHASIGLRSLLQFRRLLRLVWLCRDWLVSHIGWGHRSYRLKTYLDICHGWALILCLMLIIGILYLLLVEVLCLSWTLTPSSWELFEPLHNIALILTSFLVLYRGDFGLWQNILPVLLLVLGRVESQPLKCRLTIGSIGIVVLICFLIFLEIFLSRQTIILSWSNSLAIEF